MMYCIYIFFRIAGTRVALICGSGRPYVQVSGFRRGSSLVVLRIMANRYGLYR